MPTIPHVNETNLKYETVKTFKWNMSGIKATRGE